MSKLDLLTKHTIRALFEKETGSVYKYYENNNGGPYFKFHYVSWLENKLIKLIIEKEANK